jgi:hypothetical protein
MADNDATRTSRKRFRVRLIPAVSLFIVSPLILWLPTAGAFLVIRELVKRLLTSPVSPSFVTPIHIVVCAIGLLAGFVCIWAGVAWLMGQWKRAVLLTICVPLFLAVVQLLIRMQE